MFAAVVLATLLAGDQPATPESVQTLPAGRAINELATSRSPAPRPRQEPLLAELSIGWVTTDRVDPFGRTGATSFSAAMPLAGIRLRGQTWYAELAGQLMHTSLTNRNVFGSVGRDMFRTGPLRWGLGAEGAEIRFRRDDFRTADVLVGTNRTATIGMVSAGVGIGPYRGASVRLTALGGWYQNRYGSILEFPDFSGDEPLADDEVGIYGGRLTFDGVTIANRIEFGGSVRYLQLSGHHAASVPGHELSGSATLNIRLFRIRGRQLFIGGLARFGPSGPSLLADKTFGLRGIWRLRK